MILEEINASGCIASQGHAQMYIMGTLLRHGSAEQKQRYLPKIATGELRLQAFGVTEPTTGSDTTKLKTRAVRDGNRHYIVNGQKVWTSRARHSDLMLLLARTTPVEEVKRRTDGLSVFLVDLRESLGKGLEIRPIEAMINHNTNEVFFDNLKVPADNLIGEEGKGFRYILDGMNAERGPAEAAWRWRDPLRRASCRASASHWTRCGGRTCSPRFASSARASATSRSRSGQIRTSTPTVPITSNGRRACSRRCCSWPTSTSPRWPVAI